VEQLLRQNVAREEERAQIAQWSTEELLHAAIQAEGEQPGEENGLVDKAKDTLTGLQVCKHAASEGPSE